MRAITFRNEAVERGIELRLGAKGFFVDCGETAGDLPSFVNLDRKHPMARADVAGNLRSVGARSVRMDALGIYWPHSSPYPFITSPKEDDSRVLLLIDTLSWYLPPSERPVAGYTTVIEGNPSLVAKGLYGSNNRGRTKSLCYLVTASVGDTIRVLTTSDTVSFLRVLPDSTGSAYVKVYDLEDYEQIPNVKDFEGSAWP